MRVFKYRGGDEKIFKRDLDSLASDTFWAPIRETLNDPSEGFLSIDNVGSQLDDLIKMLVPGVSKIDQSRDSLTKALMNVLGQRDKVGIFSLSQSYKDELLWAHYTYSHKGFCIEYDLSRIINSGGGDWYSFPVKYVEEPPTLDLQDLTSLSNDGGKSFVQKMIGYKSVRWSYEREIRVICSRSGTQRCDYQAVRAIYFGLKMPEPHKAALMSGLQGRNIEYYQMQLHENSYELTAVKVKDAFADAHKYIPELAQIKDYAIDPDALNEKWRPFADYMPKVAEIARRLPYAKSVEMVEVSYDRSSATEPVFFASVLRHDIEVCKSEYYTMPEIEKQYAAISRTNE